MRYVCLTAGVLLGAATAIAQQPAAGQPVTLAMTLKNAYNGLKRNLTEAAAKMPEADYTSKPSTMPEVRTYGQLFAHVATAQFGPCAAATGQPNPNQGRNLEMELKTKAEFQKALADSFALCDKAFDALTDQNALEFITQGRGQATRAGALAGLLAHSNEMYGTAGVYLRAKNIVPPSTENQPARGGMPGGGAPPAGRQ
jgi:hypothetical protein